jgi:hypothetical protein
MHGQNSSKIDFNYLDPTGDGTSGPIRCSWCHWDPAMGETKAPGLAAVWPNYLIMAGATFTKTDVKVSTRSFSDVLHKFHTQNAADRHRLHLPVRRRQDLSDRCLQRLPHQPSNTWKQPPHS